MGQTHGARPTATSEGCSNGQPKPAHPGRSGTGLCPPAPPGASGPAFGHAMGRARRPWQIRAGRGHTGGWINVCPGQEKLCTAPDTQCQGHLSCHSPLLALGCHCATHPACTSHRSGVRQQNWDLRNRPQPNTAGEEPRCRSCPKGPRALKHKLGPPASPICSEVEREPPGCCLHPHPTARGGGTRTPPQQAPAALTQQDQDRR